MEWKDILIGLFGTASFLWGVHVFRATRKDKQTEKQTEASADVEIAHLTDGAGLRKDLIERLDKALERIDRLETQLAAANERINQFQATVNNLVLEKTILENEKKMLQQDIERREHLFETEMQKKEGELDSLRKRVLELEREVGELKAHQNG